MRLLLVAPAGDPGTWLTCGWRHAAADATHAAQTTAQLCRWWSSIACRRGAAPLASRTAVSQLARKRLSSRDGDGRAGLGTAICDETAPATMASVFAFAFSMAVHGQMTFARPEQLWSSCDRSFRYRRVSASKAYRLNALSALRAMDCMRRSAIDELYLVFVCDP